MNHEAWTSCQCWFSVAKKQILLTELSKNCLIHFHTLLLQVNKAQEEYLDFQESQGLKDLQVGTSCIYMWRNVTATQILFLWAQTRKQHESGVMLVVILGLSVRQLWLVCTLRKNVLQLSFEWMLPGSSVTAAKISFRCKKHCMRWKALWWKAPLSFRAVLHFGERQDNCGAFLEVPDNLFLWTGQAGRDGKPGEKGKGFLWSRKVGIFWFGTRLICKRGGRKMSANSCSGIFCLRTAESTCKHGSETYNGAGCKPVIELPLYRTLLSLMFPSQTLMLEMATWLWKHNR